MKEFNQLVRIISDLMGPNGCPWDQKQTLISVRRYLIEEAYEVIEAINEDDRDKIVEELGDLFLNVVFLSLLGEKEKQIQLDEILRTINEKLIRRHPHVYGGQKLSCPDEVLKQWDEIKRQEKNKPESQLDTIAKDLPTLIRAQKVSKMMPFTKPDSDDLETQRGFEILSLIALCQKEGIDADMALRKVLNLQENEFRESE